MSVLAEQLAGLFPETKRHYARCLKKLSYPSPAEAEAVRQRRQRQVEEILHVYGPCEDCGFWHLTHKPLTAAQVQELWAMLDAERARFEAAWAHLQRLTRPYIRGHAMYRKSIAQMDTDFTRQVEAIDLAMGYWMAAHQRTHAMLLAQATTAAEAIAADDEALAILDASVHRYTEGREVCMADHRRYREEAAVIFNQEYPLPSYNWRQYVS